jgi:hypothetical protein
MGVRSVASGGSDSGDPARVVEGRIRGSHPGGHRQGIIPRADGVRPAFGGPVRAPHGIVHTRTGTVRGFGGGPVKGRPFPV